MQKIYKNNRNKKQMTLLTIPAEEIVIFFYRFSQHFGLDEVVYVQSSITC